MKMLHVLLASDGSDGAIRAADWIADHFDPDSIRITVASASRSPIDMGSPTFSPLPDYASSLDEVAHQDAVQACRLTQDKLSRFQSEGIVIGSGTIVDAIVAYLADHPVDAIVAGRRSHSLSRAILGSVSKELTDRSPVPVWIVP